MLVDSPTAAATADHALLLKDSIDRFLAETHNSSSSSSSSSSPRDFSGFRSIFLRLLQSSTDPSLEVLWFYSAVVHHESVSPNDAVFDRILAARDLLQLLITYSVCSSGAKSVALVAPVVAELCRVVVELEEESGGGGGGEKQTRKARKEVGALVEGVLGYISICSAKGWDSGDGGGQLQLPCCFRELVRVWTVHQTDRGAFMKRFFPLVSDDARQRFVGEKKCDVDYLAGAVIVEAFLLRFYLKFHSGGVERKQLQNDLKIWAVSSITGFGNRSFFEILLRLLLESTLPSISMLNAEDETFLRTILYDAVLLVEYRFLQPKDTVKVDDSLNSLALTRLVVAHEAIEVSRKSGDQGRGVSYINALSSSSLLHGLLKWISSHTGVSGYPNVITPRALLKWLLKLEEQGLKIFDLDILKHRLTFLDELDLVSERSEDQVLKRHDKNANDIFFFDNMGEVPHNDSDDHEMEVAGNAFISAARSMNHASNGIRKRKEMKGKERDSRVKFVKYKIHDRSAKEYFSAPKEDSSMSSGSEVDDPLSDADMEEMDV